MKILVDGQTLGTPELLRGIGRVFLEILYHLVDGDVEHDWFIAVRDQMHFEQIKPRLRSWIKPIRLPPISASGQQIEWCCAYGRQLQDISRGIGADVYWNPNPLMPNIYYPLGFHSVPRVITIYDFIPRLMPEHFQNAWGEALWHDYLARCDDLATKDTFLLAISAATARDFAEEFPTAAAVTTVCHLASDYSLFWPYIQGDYLADPPYVLYVGGFDPRKNMDNALRAFAAFTQKQGNATAIRFKVVCAYDQTAKDDYFALARELGVADRLDLTGYVEDEELGFLFRNASVFFFPSLYEGFGLPVLDALACGLPVVAGATSSIPEVCGEHAIYCDPTDTGDMARALTEAWKQRNPIAPRRSAAVAHARTFRWENAAACYMKIFKQIASSRRSARSRGAQKLTVAYLSPWPPQLTGVADYSYNLMPELLDRMDVTLFVESPRDCLPISGLAIQPIEDYPEQADSFDGAFYHLGNSLSHLKIYEHAWRFPGVIVLHDYNIHPFFYHGLMKKALQPLYEKAIKEYGPAGWAAWEDYRRSGIVPDIWQFPMSHPIARRSRATIVHSRWVAEKLGDVGKVLRVHHGAKLQPVTTAPQRLALRQRLHLDDNCLWIGIFGFVNQHKRLDSIMAATGNLYRNGYPVRILIAGEVNDNRINLDALCNQQGIKDITRNLGYVDEDTFLDCLKAVDVVCNLRYPTMGESSGSMFHALAWGKPTIISDYGSFSEYPDKVAWKVDPLSDEIDLLTLFLEAIAKCPATRHNMGCNSRSFVYAKASLTNVAETYLFCMEDIKFQKQ
jgi:glycosyltransferase involved in cell wall biosynthesis